MAAELINKRASASRALDSLVRNYGGANVLFSMPDGSTLIDQLNAVPKQAGIQKNGFDEKYSLYSLRHFTQ